MANRLGLPGAFGSGWTLVNVYFRTILALTFLRNIPSSRPRLHLPQFSTAASVTYPTIYEQSLSALNVVNLDPGWLLPSGRIIYIDFYDRLLTATLGPLVVLLFLLVSHTTLLRRSDGDDEVEARARDKHLSALSRFTFLLYSLVSSPQ